MKSSLASSSSLLAYLKVDPVDLEEVGLEVDASLEVVDLVVEDLVVEEDLVVVDPVEVGLVVEVVVPTILVVLEVEEVEVEDGPSRQPLKVVVGLDANLVVVDPSNLVEVEDPVEVDLVVEVVDLEVVDPNLVVED